MLQIRPDFTDKQRDLALTGLCTEKRRSENPDKVKRKRAGSKKSSKEIEEEESSDSSSNHSHASKKSKLSNHDEPLSNSNAAQPANEAQTPNAADQTSFTNSVQNHQTPSSNSAQKSFSNAKSSTPSMQYNKENDSSSFMNQPLFERSPLPKTFSRYNSANFINYNPPALPNISNDFSYITSANALLDQDTCQSPPQQIF